MCLNNFHSNSSFCFFKKDRQFLGLFINLGKSRKMLLNFKENFILFCYYKLLYIVYLL